MIKFIPGKLYKLNSNINWDCISLRFKIHHYNSNKMDYIFLDKGSKKDLIFLLVEEKISSCIFLFQNNLILINNDWSDHWLIEYKTK